MVSDQVPWRVRSGKKRKYKMEESVQEFQGELDIDPMDQAEDNVNGVQEFQGELDIDPMDQAEDNVNGVQEFQGELDIDPMDQAEDNVNCVQQVQGENVVVPMDQSLDPMDCISKLPLEVIHHILSLLRNVKDIVRTSILSRKWRGIWYSYSLLVFDERKFKAGIGHEDTSQKMFRDHVSASLNAHVERKLPIKKLVLHMVTFMISVGLEDALLMDHWLTLAKESGIKELDFHANKGIDIFPPSFFSSVTLTGLRLSCCNLGFFNNIKLPNLKNLYLQKLESTQHNILNLIFSCRQSIEDLRLIQCSGLRNLCFANLNRLNRVEIYNCNKLKSVKINAPYLDAFGYCGKRTNSCKVDLEDCKSLKRLSLDHPQVTRDFCEKQISNFPLLEKLDLTVSDTMKYVTIRNPQLQSIALKGYKKLGDVTIDAPNLLSFEFKGESMPSFGISAPFLMNIKLSFEPQSRRKDVDNGDNFWTMMRNFIGRFDPQGFILVLSSNESIVIHEDMDNIRFAPVPNLCFEMIKSSASFGGILYNLLRTHPVFLSVVSPVVSEFHKVVHEMIKIKDQDPICCSYNTSSNKCWRHFLKDIKFQDLEDIKLEDIKDKRIKSWFTWLKSESTVFQDGTSRKKSLIVGPWGGNGGNSWDDGSFTGVREVTLVYDRCIDSIRVVYDKNGKPFPAEKHGGVGGHKTAEIKLQYPDEFLISVSGHYCPVVRGGTPVIRSLTFKSNRRTFGPYGVEEGTPFTFSIDGGHVVGFKGRGDWYLDSIAFTLSSAPSKSMQSMLHKVQRRFSRLTTFAPKSSSSSKDA